MRTIIIEKAIEGGFQETAHISDERQWFVFMFPSFWKSLAKSCNWGKAQSYSHNFEPTVKMEMWKWNAFEFHRINLTEGFDKAVEWLSNLISQ